MVHVDLPSQVTSERAADLMAYHLSLAAAYYEGTDLDKEKLYATIGEACNELAARAGCAWLDTLDIQYECLDNPTTANED